MEIGKAAPKKMTGLGRGLGALLQDSDNVNRNAVLYLTKP